MRLKDIDIQSCDSEKVKASMLLHGVSKDLLDSYRFLYLYTEAVTFIVGLHPAGRFVIYEDMIVASTESGLRVFMDPNIAADQQSWSDRPGKDNLEYNANLGYYTSPAEFIEMFISASLYEKGTPPYVSKECL